MLTMEDLMPRVEKGAAWLDGKLPGWFGRINLDDLDLASGCACILGQCFGHYAKAPEVKQEFSFIWAGQVEHCEIHREGWAVDHGFNLDQAVEFIEVRDGCIYFSGQRTWDQLREAWVTVILSRRFAATVPSADAVVPVGRA